MSLRFIIGRAGTGKTWQCLAEIAERQSKSPEGPLICLVPEQATFHTEKELLKRCGRDGAAHAQALSFQRLAWRVLQETGGGVYPALNEMGKSMILRRLLDQHAGEIKTFARVIDKPGFLEELSRCISEFKTYHVKPQMLEECLEHLDGTDNSDLKGKLGELSVIFREFEDYLAGQYLDSEDCLEKLAANIARANFLEQAEIWLDGFYGFSPLEYAVIRELLLKVPRLHLTLCLDAEHIKKRLTETDLFFQPWDTYQRMMRIAQEIKCPLTDALVLDYQGRNRFSENRELAFLEESFFTKKEIYEAEVTAIHLGGAANRRAELEAAARAMVTLAREKGYRYQDMAVLVRDFEPYELLLETVFTDHEIPYFLDKKRALKHHPLVDLLSASLEILEKGWNYEPVFRYLKTDLASLSRQEADLLENYCLRHGIRGSAWTDGKPWTYLRRYTLGEERNGEELTAAEEKTLKRINRARFKAAAGMARLQQAAKKARTGRDYAACVFGLLEDLGVARKLEYWSNTAEKEGRLEEAQVHAQVWRQVIELLDQLVEALGDVEMKLPEFSSLVKSGLESIELGLIPPGLDQVLVGSPERSRNPDLKAVFVLGANDGILPARLGRQGLFSDDDKKKLALLDLELAPTSEKRLFFEQFLIYLALTRASDYLWVSYALADEEGRALHPSYIINYLDSLYKTAPDHHLLRSYLPEPEGHDDEKFIAHPLPTLGYLAKNLRQAVDQGTLTPFWREVYNWYLGQEKWKDLLQKVVTGLFTVNREAHISHGQVWRLYGGGRLLTSVSRLEKFRACPFAHFLNYGMKLREREEYRLNPPDLGAFFHAALENVCKSVQGQGLSLADLRDEQVRTAVQETIARIAPQLQNEILLSSARYRYLTRKFERTVGRALLVLREHERRGAFRPLGLEIAFGPGERLPGLELKLADGSILYLRGRIDRIDGACGEDGYYLRVIDYKSGALSLSLLEIYYGLKLQLLAYLDVVLTHAPSLVQGVARPGGAFYFRIRDPFVSAEGPQADEEIEKRIRRQLKMKGYLLKDPTAVRLMDREIRGASDLVPAALSAGGEFYKNVETQLTLEDFTRLRSYVAEVLKTTGQEIMSGNVAIKPYRFKGTTPCRYCPYHPVCRFDAGQPGENYRHLPVIEHDQAWREIEAGRVDSDA